MKKNVVAQKMFVGFGYVLKDEQGNIIGFQRSVAERMFKYISVAEVASEDDICYIPEHFFDELGKDIDVISLHYIKDKTKLSAMTLKDIRKATAERIEEEFGDIFGKVDDKSYLVDSCVEQIFDSLSGEDFRDVIEDADLGGILNLDGILKKALAEKKFTL